MTAGTLDFEGNFKIEAGVTFDHTFTFVDQNGVLLDLSPYTKARLMLRLSSDATGPPIITLNENTTVNLDAGLSGIEIEPVATGAGTVRVVISALDSTNVSYDTAGDSPLASNRIGIVQCELTAPGANTPTDDKVIRLFQGTYLIDPEGVR